MSGSALSRHMLRVVSRSVPLPTLKQGTTLSIRSQIPQISLRIQSGWRDDGAATLVQSLRGDEQSTSVDMLMAHEKDQVTSLGRSESHLSITLQENTTRNQTYSILESLQDDNDESNPVTDQDGEAQVKAWFAAASDEGDNGHSSTELTLEVPEKVNIICELDLGGSIDISSKIEGDVKLKTTNGNIRVKKLRGHTVDLETSGGCENYIHASDLLEAQQLKLNLLEGGRLRAKRIHGDTVDIRVTAPSQSQQQLQPTAVQQLDDDDEGALVDISSMYVSGTGGAHVALEGPLRPVKRGVRIKSHHGPALVNTTGVHPPSTEGQPLVELGSVNGSCEVAIVDSPTQDQTDDDWVACQVHYDSISPESVSLISTQTGSVALTFDRKMEADLRLLSTGGESSKATMYLEDMAAVLADEDDSNEVVKALGASPASGNSNDNEKEPSRISIATKSFTKSQFYAFSSPETFNDLTVEYMEGWVENKSHEPDSRFEMKTRSEEGLGKIRLDGAANQALKSFSSASSSPEDQSTTDAARPLIVAATVGNITVETLSWLGAIARRYGLDEKGKDLGRQATRRGRVVLPADE